MQTKDLKVYQDTVEFCKVLHRLTRNFPRFEKYSIGGKLFNDSLELLPWVSKTPPHIQVPPPVYKCP